MVHVFVYYCVISCIILYYPLLLCIILYYRGLVCIIVYCVFSLIIVYYLCELYIWFMRERGIDGKLALEDLNILGERINGVREETSYRERKRRNQGILVYKTS